MKTWAITATGAEKAEDTQNIIKRQDQIINKKKIFVLTSSAKINQSMNGSTVQTSGTGNITMALKEKKTII
eukprot:CAMPEP_0184858142 /NCGR_PEP_ID=MMETSP0580-20130426/3261_1 /TAXON_ID=1118495 /ORGANISM="Dactyliosolen fragilissimus" /LENGTH=70 /DNA_ID=CAMNT_0027354125 /DNA_START=873 /DNA_END=1085 /DNA_ORIENTATION=-